MPDCSAVVLDTNKHTSEEQQQAGYDSDKTVDDLDNIQVDDMSDWSEVMLVQGNLNSDPPLSSHSRTEDQQTSYDSDETANCDSVSETVQELVSGTELDHYVKKRKHDAGAGDPSSQVWKKRCGTQGCLAESTYRGRCDEHIVRKQCAWTSKRKGIRCSVLSVHKFCEKHGKPMCVSPGCWSYAVNSTNHCARHGGGIRCSKQDCPNWAVTKALLCNSHDPKRRCRTEGCTNVGSGKSVLCVKHGGGTRCSHPGCTKGAENNRLCIKHGGGARCGVINCNRSAHSASGVCRRHSVIFTKCKVHGCENGVDYKTSYCIKHGSAAGERKVYLCRFPLCKKGIVKGGFCTTHGERCHVLGCSSGVRGGTNYCTKHGTNGKCNYPSCTTARRKPSQFCVKHGGGCKHRNCSNGIRPGDKYCATHMARAEQMRMLGT